MIIDVPIKCPKCGHYLTGFTASDKSVIVCWYCALKRAKDKFKKAIK